MDGDISIGAVGAALIAGVISLLGLIISKEQKTSEFRQAWVDALRSEITVYLTNFNAIADAVGVPYKDQSEKVKALSPLYSKINEASFAITLRVNPDEDRSKAVLSCMRRFIHLTGDDSKMTAKNIRPIELEFLNASKELLKYEWKRVKRGELTFVLTKLLALTVILCAIIYSLFNGNAKHPTELKPDSRGTVFNNITNEVYQAVSPATQCTRDNIKFELRNNSRNSTSDRARQPRASGAGHVVTRATGRTVSDTCRNASNQ